MVSLRNRSVHNPIPEGGSMFAPRLGVHRKENHMRFVRYGVLARTVGTAGARSVLYRAPKNSDAETRRENGSACHESPQRLARRTPSPQRGEGWGEGVRTSEQKLGRPNPLILSFSPISAFTRVFDALWGRRDAASRSRRSSADVATIPRAPQCAARARALGHERLCVVKPPSPPSPAPATSAARGSAFRSA